MMFHPRDPYGGYDEIMEIIKWYKKERQYKTKVEILDKIEGFHAKGYIVPSQYDMLKEELEYAIEERRSNGWAV